MHTSSFLKIWDQKKNLERLGKQKYHPLLAALPAINANCVWSEPRKLQALSLRVPMIQHRLNGPFFGADGIPNELIRLQEISIRKDEIQDSNKRTKRLHVRCRVTLHMTPILVFGLLHLILAASPPGSMQVCKKSGRQSKTPSDWSIGTSHVIMIHLNKRYLYIYINKLYTLKLT